MKSIFKSSLATSLLLLALGILLVFESEATITTISYVIGGILIAIGTFAIMRFISNNKNNNTNFLGLDIVYGIVTIILGILIITNPHAIASILPIVLGIAIIIGSANKIQYAFELKNESNDMWKTTLIISIVSTICGVVLLFNPFAGAVLIMKIVGIFIIIYAILDSISTIIIKRSVDSFKRGMNIKTIEAEIIEEKSEKKTKKSRKNKK